jgi:hypothetical protein
VPPGSTALAALASTLSTQMYAQLVPGVFLVEAHSDAR